MNETEARALVAVLTAAFPRQQLEQPTLDLYTAALCSLDSAPAAKQAVETAITEAHAFPTIAAIREAYRGSLRQESLDDYRQRVELEPGEPESRELPAEVRDYLSKLRLRGMDRSDKLGAERLASLPSAGRGQCSDCKQEAERVRHGSLDLCSRCVGARIRVAVDLDEQERREREQAKQEPVF